MRFPYFEELDTDFHPKSRTAEYVRGYGWIKDGDRTRVKKPHYHFIWPKDGKNESKWGRAKDILSGKGPDIHVTIGAEKMDYMKLRQRRSTWARHVNLDDRHHDHRKTLQIPWASTAARRAGLRYDFYERAYRKPDRYMMTDARWYTGDSSKGVPFPKSFRDVVGQWHHHNPNALRRPDENWDHLPAGFPPFF